MQVEISDKFSKELCEYAEKHYFIDSFITGLTLDSFKYYEDKTYRMLPLLLSGKSQNNN